MKGPIACVGAGVIGRGWGVVFARAGFHVRLYDSDKTYATAAHSFISGFLREQSEQAGLASGEVNQALERVTVARSLEEALSGVGYVQESILEDVSAKRSLFQLIDALAPEDAILASSTSEIPGSAFLSELPGAARCLVAHPLNPPFLIPLVEICSGGATSQPVIDSAVEFMKSIGQAPIVLRREINGYIANRLQLALLGEAMHLVAERYCGPREIDDAVKHGLGLRWALMGPFETGHLNADTGVGEYLTKFEKPMRRILSSLNIEYPWSEELINTIDEEMRSQHSRDLLGIRRKWRDKNLASLRRVLADVN